MQITVFCASSKRVSSVYYDAVEKLGQTLVAAETDLVYGGGATGLMGCLADTVISCGGRISGVIPKFMKNIELQHPRLDRVTVVADMRERKRLLLEGSDAVVALPGGCGTFEEFLEVMTLKRLGQYTKPIVIVNVNGFYDPLIRQLHHTIDEGFMDERHADMWRVITDPAAVMEAVLNSPDWNEDAIEFAAVT